MLGVIRVALVGLFCLGAAAAAVVLMFWMLEPDPREGRRTNSVAANRRAGPDSEVDRGQESPKPGDTRQDAYIDTDRLEDGGFSMALEATGPLQDETSLRELREAIRARVPNGFARIQRELDALTGGSLTPVELVVREGQLRQQMGLLLMYEGRFAEAVTAFEKAMEVGHRIGIPPRAKAKMTALLGIAALRRGELDNCVACLGPSSCIFPIATEAVHSQKTGSRQAVKWFSAYLKDSPGDLRIKWLLNIAHMTLGEYPDKVPPRDLIPLDSFRSKMDIGVFPNVAPLIGLTSRGPNAAGGSLFDDFTGDGLPDIFTTSLDAETGALLYVNRGDGTFEDRSTWAGLDDQVYALNASCADFDNDGDLDILMMRGAWETARRLSLLQNRGDGRFEDVTLSAGLATPIQTLASAWGDYDNDGFVDLFVCGEYLPPIANGFGPGSDSSPDPRNRCRLYHNQGDGTFIDVAGKAGVLNERCAKGASWGDYDGDGKLDLLVSNMGQECRLYHNEEGDRFVDVAADLGISGDLASFACWFWDYDNDGLLDFYIHDNRTTLAVTAAVALGMKPEGASRPRLYRNLGSGQFREVGRDVGLDRPMTPMGCNFGDIDNDGYLDMYLGTGWISTSSLVPNLMFKNVEGRRFEDITMSSGTGHLQKGHGVSFADYDWDGDLDLFVETGGPVPGDKAHNLLFQNPGHGRHWIKVKLVGTRTNRAALGARIRVDLNEPDGTKRSIYRTVGNNSSFGGNSLVESIGLSRATRVAELTVSWPTSRTTQSFHDVAADQAIEITEGAEEFRALRLAERMDSTH